MAKDFTHNLTSYHAKYFAFEHTRKSPSNELGKLSTTPLKISVLEEFLGSSGWMQVSLLTINSFETEKYLLLAGTTDQGISLDPAVCQRFFSVNASENNTCYFTLDVSEQLKHLLEQQKLTNIDANQQRNAQFFDDELNKLEKWADDMKPRTKLIPGKKISWLISNHTCHKKLLLPIFSPFIG